MYDEWVKKGTNEQLAQGLFERIEESAEGGLDACSIFLQLLLLEEEKLVELRDELVTITTWVRQQFVLSETPEHGYIH